LKSFLLFINSLATATLVLADNCSKLEDKFSAESGLGSEDPAGNDD
jgi:hypothetical protein